MNQKPQSEEYKAFERLLGTVLKVSKPELQQRLDEEKREKADIKAPSSRVPVASSKRT